MKKKVRKLLFSLHWPFYLVLQEEWIGSGGLARSEVPMAGSEAELWTGWLGTVCCVLLAICQDGTQPVV